MPTTALVVHSDPDILGGTPVFVGTRVPFRNLIDYLERNHSFDEFLDAFPTVSRVERRDQRDSAVSPAVATTRCRSGTSFAGGERKRTFADSFGSKEQRFADVLGVEIRIEREDLVGGLSFGDQPDDGCDRNP